FYPGIDDLVFAGFAQATPTLFPFVECQARLLGAYAVGRYRLPSEPEMRRVIAEDQQFFTGHMLDRPRHTQQLDHYLYEHNIRVKEIPAGLGRARGQGAPAWARVEGHDEPMVAAAAAP
ncbi:NAD(P)/FAD-dependent oxidoreductase, partial [Streptomyces sp. SID10244]|nr:NAD(P)/FAD-dependent oxidoreductase [Streptomyces sp. SID10244]